MGARNEEEAGKERFHKATIPLFLWGAQYSYAFMNCASARSLDPQRTPHRQRILKGLFNSVTQDGKMPHLAP